jgi:hypothetical protein
METLLQLQERQRVERLKAEIPPISPLLMPFLILGGGVVTVLIFFSLGAEFVYIWPAFATWGFAIFSVNSLIVRRRLERLEEEHRIERSMLQGALRASSKRETPPTSL